VTAAGAPCFAACAQPRNQSSACWIGCYFDTVLGPGSGTMRKPGGGEGGGAMELGLLTEAWVTGFAEPRDGGCAACPQIGPCPDPEAGEEGEEGAPAQRVRRYGYEGGVGRDQAVVAVS